MLLMKLEWLISKFPVNSINTMWEFMILEYSNDWNDAAGCHSFYTESFSTYPSIVFNNGQNRKDVDNIGTALVNDDWETTNAPE